MKYNFSPTEKLLWSNSGLAALLKNISVLAGEGAEIVFHSFFLPRFLYW